VLKLPDIIFSIKDKASQNIFKQLIEHYDFQDSNQMFDNHKILINKNIRLVTIEQDLIFADYIDVLNSDLFIFASRHKSESGNPSLLTHCTGNWNNEADFGGEPRTLGYSSGSAIKTALIELFRQKKLLELDQFNVNLEVSHHGPTKLATPLVFIELGSTPEDWKNESGGLAVANAIMKVASSKTVYKNYIGIGGPHYAQKFTDLVSNQDNDLSISHVVPKYMLDYFDKEMLIQTIKRSKEPLEAFLLDWKGMTSEQRDRVIKLLELKNYKYLKAKSIKLES